jgi:hypothetical protein
MKKILKITSLLLLLVTFTLSCDRVGDETVGETSTKEMSGDWYVTFKVGGVDVYNLGYTLLSTYNTAANNGSEMWIEDHKNSYWYKMKTPINYSAKTFGGTGLASSVPDGSSTYDVTCKITDGKIVKDGATTSGGNKSDLISYKIEFSDDPGTIYEVNGYKRTGFAEDEH